MKKIVLLSAFCLFLFSHCSDNPTDVSKSVQVTTIINQTNLDSLTLSVEQLSGQISILINGVQDTINSRNRDFPDNALAADFLFGKLQGYGLEVSKQAFNIDGENVIAVQRGTTHPNQSYIICAHYDNMPGEDLAPGADDNASGTAAVLEAARLLSSFNSTYTVVYALWDEEEQGLHGSRFYAQSARANNETILGAINIDMIGWDSDDDGTALVSFQTVGNSLNMANKVFELAKEHDLDLNPVVVEHVTRSDNIAFWENGYAAIAISEHFGQDFNAHYHSPNDRIEYFNMYYFHNCARMAIATLAELAELKIN